LAREKDADFGYVYRLQEPIYGKHSRSRPVTFSAGAITVRQSRDGPLLAAAFNMSRALSGKLKRETRCRMR
jgi:hypothetical protein